MRILTLTLSISLLSACSTISPYAAKTPVDEALKICGLGYSTEVGGVFHAAYQYAEGKGGADFSAKMQEGLETQLTALAKNENFGSKLGEGEMFKIIQTQQKCVVDYASSLRPKTRGELVSECMSDLQRRLSGNGSMKKAVNIKNWIVNSQHGKHTDTDPVVSAVADYAAYQKPIMVQCRSENYVYQDLEVVAEDG